MKERNSYVGVNLLYHCDSSYEEASLAIIDINII